MTDVTLESNTVTVNLGTYDAPSGGVSLTTLNRLLKVAGTGVMGMATIAESGITGVLTLTKTGSTARTVTFPDAAITVARSDAAQTFTGDQTFAGTILAAAISATAAAGVKTQAAATQDAVAIIGRAGGSGSYVASITPPALSASITLTLPAATGTLAALNAAQSWTAHQTLTDVDLVLSATTGTKIGTAVGQKLGFWGVTPVVQPAGAAQAAIAATLTDSTGDSGTHDDTLADGLTSVAPAAYTAHAAGAVPVTSNAATDLDTTAAAVANLRGIVATLVTDVTTQNQNDSDMAQKIIELVTLVNAMRTALVNAGIMKGAA